MLLTAVLAAFVAFTGVATLVPGRPRGARAARRPAAARSRSAGSSCSRSTTRSSPSLLGYRLAVLRYGSAADAARSALTYALVIAVAAGATRAIDMPRLLGPVVLTLVFYLWDALHGTRTGAPPRAPLRAGSWSLLAVLGVVVIAWNLQLAG